MPNTSETCEIFKLRYSYRLLFDWWTAAYDRPTTSLLYCSQLESINYRNPRFDSFVDEYKELWICIQHYSETFSCLQLENSECNTDSNYNDALYQLFTTEFADFRICMNEASKYHSLLRIHRIDAARETYYQQASLHCSKNSSWNSAFRRESLILILGSKNAAIFAHGHPWVCSVEASDAHFPQTLDRGPRIALCPWLKNRNEDPFGLGGWPEYLWHLTDRCLV